MRVGLAPPPGLGRRHCCVAQMLTDAHPSTPSVTPSRRHLLLICCCREVPTVPHVSHCHELPCVCSCPPPWPPPAGTYCQYAAVDEDQLALLPQGVELATAGGMPLVALTAWQALQAGHPQPGRRVLIMAASGGAHANLSIITCLVRPWHVLLHHCVCSMRMYACE